MNQRERLWETELRRLIRKLLRHGMAVPRSPSYALEFLSVAADLRYGPPRFIVLNGPAGGGTSTAGKILETYGARRILRVTDRPRRPYERHGKDYLFVSREKFSDFVARDKMLYWKSTYDSRRGFLKESFAGLKSRSGAPWYSEGESSLAALRRAQRRLRFPASSILHVFLIPPSYAKLRNRLVAHHRSGVFSRAELKARMDEALPYLRKTQDHRRAFPRTVYLVSDDVERIQHLLEILVGRESSDHMTYRILRDGQPAMLTTKSQSHRKGEWHPITVTFVFNRRGELLLQQRKDSGQWDHSAAGHVMPGERIRDSALREVREELGIAPSSFEFVGTGLCLHTLTPKLVKHRFYLFRAVAEGPFRLQPSEVRRVKFLRRDQIHKELREHPRRYSGGFHATWRWHLHHGK